MPRERSDQHPRVVAALPLTPGRFADLEALFGAKGCSFARSCWCMAYREAGRVTPPAGVRLADARKQSLRALASAKLAPGLIGYDAERRPLGWISLGPREDFARLQRSRVMKPVDDEVVWSIVCFVVPGEHRGRGVASALLKHGIAWARERGARMLEAYPIDAPERTQPQWLWHGTQALFERAGFEEVARRAPTRPVMRRRLSARRRPR
jgi:GNAT superfamily N-acetyltransferase